jgi:ADP-ribose pyrophosphatase
MKNKKMVEWEKIRTEAGPDLTLFTARFDWVRNPRNGHTVKATVLETPDWANIVALTPEKKIVVVRQYRFGNQRITTELPAGIVEPGETSQETAIRELKEETGYASNEWEYLGYVEPNPAFMNNRCHHWLAKNVIKQTELELDEGEDLTVSEMNLEDIQIEIQEDRLRNVLCFSALAYVFDLSSLLSKTK